MKKEVLICLVSRLDWVLREIGGGVGEGGRGGVGGREGGGRG